MANKELFFFIQRAQIIRKLFIRPKINVLQNEVERQRDGDALFIDKNCQTVLYVIHPE